MRRRSTSIGLALGALLLVSAMAQARRSGPSGSSQPVDRDRPERRDEIEADRGLALSSSNAEQGHPFAALPALHVTNASGAAAELCLYDAGGNVAPTALDALSELLADARDPAHVHAAPIDTRTLQLVFRAAYHFHAAALEIVSGYRQPGRRSEGNHAQGKAVDFRLPGVKAAALAAYLRTASRVGVGVYTNARTQFVHLDVRERSFYWLDASPPGRTWRERPLRSATMAARDAEYHASDDYPEGTSPPSPKP